MPGTGRLRPHLPAARVVLKGTKSLTTSQAQTFLPPILQFAVLP